MSFLTLSFKDTLSAIVQISLAYDCYSEIKQIKFYAETYERDSVKLEAQRAAVFVWHSGPKDTKPDFQLLIFRLDITA